MKKTRHVQFFFNYMFEQLSQPNHFHVLRSINFKIFFLTFRHFQKLFVDFFGPAGQIVQLENTAVSYFYKKKTKELYLLMEFFQREICTVLLLGNLGCVKPAFGSCLICLDLLFTIFRLVFFRWELFVTV